MIIVNDRDIPSHENCKMIKRYGYPMTAASYISVDLREVKPSGQTMHREDGTCIYPATPDIPIYGHSEYPCPTVSDLIYILPREFKLHGKRYNVNIRRDSVFFESEPEIGIYFPGRLGNLPHALCEAFVFLRNAKVL